MTHKDISEFWTKTGELFEQTCQAMDKVWQKRKRVIDTRLLVVFIFKLVLSRNKKGYGSSLYTLWETCSDKGISLPRVDAVAASSLCEARQKLPESIFKTLNNELITLWLAYRGSPTWKGHRVFAIDSTKLNIPRGLLKYGYKIARETTRHYPYGMVSCLYNLQEQLVYDFELVPHNDERCCVSGHLARLERGDLIIFDRGYFSYLMLHQVLSSGQHAVFRLQGSSNPRVTEFLTSNNDDAVIEYTPSTTVKHGLKKRGYTQTFQSLPVRLVKFNIGDKTHVYATTLMDQTSYPVNCFPNLYHGRWGIEELYKVSKQFIDVEDFHSQTERGVKHELYGHFLLINLARMFETDARNIRSDDSQRTKFGDVPSWPEIGKTLKINFKHCLTVVRRHLEELILVPKKIITGWLDKAMAAAARIRQRCRPGRCYPRCSFKPRDRGYSFGAVPKP